jgi:ABC-type glycerol-3-phosphate transport system substrate-binding protein
VLRRRLTLVASGTALLVAGLALASCGGGNGASSTTEAETATSAATTEAETTTEQTTTQETTTTQEKEQPVRVSVVIVGGVPKGGIVREKVSKGDRVVLVVTSDVADEVHVHGYDISRDVDAGDAVRIAFVAKIPGRFEVELENRGVQIADLTVGP